MAEVKVFKTSIALPPIYRHKLKLGAKKLGISQSEFMRRAIDEYLAKLGISAIIEEEKPAQASP